MATSTSSSIVQIEAETFSIDKIPSSNTILVQTQKKKLLELIDLSALVDDMGRVGNFVRVASYGVAGCTDLEISIREIGVDVTKLCDKSAVTVSKFKMASISILQNLQSTYQFLLDGHKDIALVTLSAIADIAKNMAVAADELRKEFADEAEKVEDTLKKTMQTKASKASNKQSKTATLAIKQNADDEYENFEEKYNAAEKKQASHEARASKVYKTVVNSLLTPFLNKDVFDTDYDKKKAQEAREEKLLHLKEMKKHSEARSKALQDMAEFSSKIQQCSDDSELPEVANNALHHAIGGLKDLSAVMMNTSKFWTQMQIYCQTVTTEHSMIEMNIRSSSDILASNPFKGQAIRYYSCWVALNDICENYMRQIQKTRKDLYAYLTENPTLEEARKNVRELAKTFTKDLAAAQKAITDQEAEGDQLIEECQQNAI